MRTRSLVIAIALLLALAADRSAHAQPFPPTCKQGTLDGGALSLICVPPGWNHELVVFAHGYVAFNEPLGFYNLRLSDGTTLPEVVQGLGYAFATTSYRKNGLAVLEGVDDIRLLVEKFVKKHGAPRRTYITGASEGGLVATLLAERSPELFTNALATCGPIGSFRGQLQYFGDFRVLFDYYFPGLIPGSPIAIPDEVIAQWDDVYVPRIIGALGANPAAALELLKVGHVPFDAGDPSTVARSVIGVLWYNVFATNDAKASLGGSPFDNRFRWYFGSSNDLRLNLRVRRFAASSRALHAVQEYETDGKLTIPLITLHTTRDEIVPLWHEVLYGLKARPRGRGVFLPVPIDRYGHCNFTAPEVLTAFLALVTIP